MTTALAGRRQLLLRLGIPLAILAAAFALKAWSMSYLNGSGQSAYERGEWATAQSRFELTRVANVFQPWVAPFDTGDAQFGGGDLTGAVASFEEALTSVPQEHECTVRINLAITHGAIGDEALNRKAARTAVEAYTTGREVLATGRCTREAGQGPAQTRLAQQVDRELADKLNQAEGKPPTPTPTPTASQTSKEPPPPPTKQQQQELSKVNQNGASARSDRPSDVPSNADGRFHW